MKTLSGLTLVLLFVCPVLAFAQNQDFSKAAKIDTTHFTIYYQSGVDINKLVSQVSKQTADTASSKVLLSHILEDIFSKTSDILDVHIYSLKTDIKIFATQQDLANFYENIYHVPMPPREYCFYLDEDKAIYVSAEYFQQETLGSEMARAIMNSYFIVQPSVRIQKILSGYIEYQLHKGPLFP